MASVALDRAAGREVYLRVHVREGEFDCQYSLDNQEWSAIGGAMDGRHLSTKVAGGYVGAYLGLYAFAEAPARATFTWAEYEGGAVNGR